MNGYNFDFAVSASISEKVVKEMITKAVEEQTGRKVSRIDFKVRSVSRGYGYGEHEETVFDGVTVHFEGSKSEVSQFGNR